MRLLLALVVVLATSLTSSSAHAQLATANVTVVTAICQTISGPRCIGGDSALDGATIDYTIHSGFAGNNPQIGTITVPILGFGGSKLQALPQLEGYTVCEVPVAHTAQGDVPLLNVTPIAETGQESLADWPLCVHTPAALAANFLNQAGTLPPTPTPTPTPTATATASATPTSTLTATASSTPTPTGTLASTPVPTAAATATPTLTPAATPPPATAIPSTPSPPVPVGDAPPGGSKPKPPPCWAAPPPVPEVPGIIEQVWTPKERCDGTPQAMATVARGEPHHDYRTPTPDSR